MFPSGISTTSDDCSSKESMISIGICSRYVHQLAEYNENIYLGYPLPMDSLTNVTTLCASIEKCFEKSNCRAVRKAGKFYEETCDEKEMRIYRVKECLKIFHDRVYSGATNCTKLYNYTSSDLDIRKSAFEGKGKECFLSITNHSCRPESREYLKHSYDKLVDYLTIDNDGPDQCNSLYDELNSYQCIAYRYVVPGFLGELGSSRLMRKPFENNETEPMLEEARNCYRKCCKYIDSDYQYLDKLSRDIANYKSDYPVVMKVLSHFDSCFEDTLKYTDVDNYDCVRKLPQKSGTSHESAPIVKLSGFLRDKQCKLIMMSECRMSSKLFEEGWEMTRNQMKTLWEELNNE